MASPNTKATQEVAIAAYLEVKSKNTPLLEIAKRVGCSRNTLRIAIKRWVDPDFCQFPSFRRDTKARPIITREEAKEAYDLVMQEKVPMRDVCLLFERSVWFLTNAIRQFIDPELDFRVIWRKHDIQKNRKISREQYEYAREIYTKANLDSKAAAKLIAEKWDFSWWLIYYMMLRTKTFEEALAFLSKFDYSTFHGKGVKGAPYSRESFLGE